jgi:cytochrome c oxidase subunit II
MIKRYNAFRWVALSGFLVLSGCGGSQSALDPAGPQAGRIAQLWWLLLGVSTVVFIIVVAIMLAAVVRSHRADRTSSERQMTSVVTGAAVVTTVILFVFLIASLSTGKALSVFASGKDVVHIEVTGHQWWWEVRYPNSIASQTVTTANEIHIPVGRAVIIRGMAQDVIHSFWAPNLHGKRDLIPSRVTTITIEADRPAIFRGQCAEFCGLQHAHMSFLVIAESASRFSAWLDSQRRPAISPRNEMALRGEQVFLSAPCVLCHTIRGIDAFGQVAPDLTHLASRQTLAAGTLPNTPGHLAGWIVDPQNIKPGTRMPPVNIPATDMDPLLAYLGSLQ